MTWVSSEERKKGEVQTFKPFNRCSAPVLSKVEPLKSFYNRRTSSNPSNGSIVSAVPNVMTLYLLRKKYRRQGQVSITS